MAVRRTAVDDRPWTVDDDCPTKSSAVDERWRTERVGPRSPVDGDREMKDVRDREDDRGDRDRGDRDERREREREADPVGEVRKSEATDPFYDELL